MTIREYISQKLKAFNLTDANFIDIEEALGMSLSDEYTSTIASSVGVAMTKALAELILAPRLSNVNESGFSVSWNYEELGKYYLYLCKKWGVEADDKVLTVSGLSAITDKSNIW